MGVGQTCNVERSDRDPSLSLSRTLLRVDAASLANDTRALV
jgi:hypothetical protein